MLSTYAQFMINFRQSAVKYAQYVKSFFINGDGEMKKVFKWIGIVLGSLIGLILVLGAVLYFIGNAASQQDL